MSASNARPSTRTAPPADDTDAAARAGGARTDVEAGEEPHREAMEPHVVAGERREPQRLGAGEYDPGQEGDPKLTDSIDEGLARALPLDDALPLPEDLPVADAGAADGFPLVDPAPNGLPDDAVGDVDDEAEDTPGR